jgi:site-specific DNA recombinase
VSQRSLHNEAGLAQVSREVRRRKLVAIYLRVSSEEQAEKETILNQRDAIEPWLTERGFAAFDWYCDDGVSGDVPFHVRPEGARLLEDARAGKFDGVVCFKMDRLSRRTEDSLRAVRVIHEELGLMFLCSHQDIHVDSSTGRFFLTIMSGIAELEKATILERTKAGKLRRARAGKWPQSRAPFGYRIIAEGLPDAGYVLLHEVDSLVVRRIFEMCIAGVGMGKIAAYLQAAGVPAPRASQKNKSGRERRWCSSSIHVILHNQAYMGTTAYGRTKGIKRDGKVVAIVATPEAEHIPLTLPVLIDAETFAAAQARIQRNKDESSRNEKRRKYLLRSKVLCGKEECGLRFCGNMAISKNRHGVKYHYPLYRCGSSWGAEKRKCGNVSVRADLLEAAIWRRVRAILEKPAAWLDEVRAELEQDRPADAGDLAEELAAIETALVELDGREKRVRRAHAKGLYDVPGDEDKADETLAAELSDVNAERGVLKQEQERLAGLLGGVANVDEAMVATAEVLRSLRSGLEAAEEDEDLRREVMMLMVERIEVSPGEVKGAPCLSVTWNPSRLALPGGAASNCFQSSNSNRNQLARTEALDLAA